MSLPRILLAGALWISVLVGSMQSAEPSCEFLEYVRACAKELRGGDKPPAHLKEWESHRAVLRQRLEQAWGGFPSAKCPLEPRKLGVLERDGYRVEKIVFQTRPGVWMTANAYVPKKEGKLPAVLVVHGHWHGAKQDPTVQARCMGLVKLGFFVLAVDAFGAGERGVGKALGEYHGEMVAATLLPVGLPLCGLQVYENMRAVDYLCMRPEVDAARLGVTGASGGGNQSMYAGAWEERLAAAVPVCSVGNYQAYLGVACCMCEVVPGALQFTEEWGVLSLTAPRALMVVNASQDGIQFSVAEAQKSLALARPVYALSGKSDRVHHAIFQSHHDYNQPMRETMYGWMTRFLKGEGDGSPIPEAAIKAEDPETLRCFPGQSRPDDFVTIPQFAAAEAGKLLATRQPPKDGQPWQADRRSMLEGLNACLCGGAPPRVQQKALLATAPEANCRKITFRPEPGLTLTARQEPGGPKPAKLALLLDLDGAEKTAAGELAAELRRDGWSLVTMDLRATGTLAYARDQIGRAPDHNTAEWSLWLGRPLLGQWVTDVRRLLDALHEIDGQMPAEVLACGVGPAGVVAICVAALDERITKVAAVGSLASYVTKQPYQGQRLGLMAPGILRRAGDIPHLAAMIAPRRLIVAGGVSGAGELLDAAALANAFAFTRQAYNTLQTADALRVLPGVGATEIVKSIR